MLLNKLLIVVGTQNNQWKNMLNTNNTIKECQNLNFSVLLNKYASNIVNSVSTIAILNSLYECIPTLGAPNIFAY